MLCILEGLDAVGKSTVTKLLVERLQDLGFNAKACREPGGTSFGEAVRPLLLDKTLALCAEAQTLLFVASRMQLLTEVIPELSAGAILVFDRLDYSTIAYQVYAGSVSKHLVQMLNEACRAKIAQARSTDNLALHDIEAFHLKVDAETAAKRLKQTGKTGDRFESQNDEYRAKLRQAYDDMEDPFLASKFGVSPLTPIDASVSPAEVVEAIVKRLVPHLAQHPLKAKSAEA